MNHFDKPVKTHFLEDAKSVVQTNFFDEVHYFGSSSVEGVVRGKLDVGIWRLKQLKK